MAHKRKDTLVAPGERWKHLRPFEKRKQAKAERKFAKRVLAFGEQDVVCHNFAFRSA